MKRISTDAEYLDGGTVTVDADGIPITITDKTYVDAQTKAATWPKGAFAPANLPSMDDAPEGVVTVNTIARSQAWGLPEGQLGFVVTHTANDFKAQHFYGISSSGLREYSRKYAASGWSEWYRTDDQYDRATIYADSKLVEAKDYADSRAGGSQPVRIPLNRPWGAGAGHTRAYANRSCRIPVNLPVPSTGGIRVGFNNVEYLTETIYTTPVEVTGVFVGKGVRDASGELTGEFDGNPISLISEPLILPADGSTVFTAWGAQDFTVDKDTLIGYGIRSDGEGVFLYNQGIGWQTDSRTNAGSGAPGNATTQTLLGVSIELNTPAPRVLVTGDSRAVAAASGKPLVGSPANIAAASGWIPRNYSIGGSRMRHWSENTLIWDDIAETGADCALMILGSNDIFGGGTTLEQLKDYFLTTVAKIRAAVGEVPIFTMELYPRFIAPAPELVQMMEEFNAWTYGLPGGISGVVPIDNLIDPSTGAVHAKWMSSDDVHLSLAGNVRLAQNFQIV